MRLSEMPPEIKRIAPGLGEHNDYVLQELLGYSEQEVTELVKEQVIYRLGKDLSFLPHPIHLLRCNSTEAKYLRPSPCKERRNWNR